MRQNIYSFFLFFLSLLCSFAAGKGTTTVSAQPTETPHVLELTAIVTSAENYSTFECWSLSNEFETSNVGGIDGASVLALGDYTDAQYTVLPPHFNGGKHNAPAPQLVVFISGLANISTPETGNYATVHGGRNGAIIAVDTAGSGHITMYPSNRETVGLVFPFAGGVVPGHNVAHDGPCRRQSIREMA